MISPGTKGALLVGNANGNPIPLPVGADGQVLVADAAQSAGVRWRSLADLIGELLAEGGHVNLGRMDSNISSGAIGSGGAVLENIQGTLTVASSSPAAGEVSAKTATTSAAAGDGGIVRLRLGSAPLARYDALTANTRLWQAFTPTDATDVQWAFGFFSDTALFPTAANGQSFVGWRGDFGASGNPDFVVKNGASSETLANPVVSFAAGTRRRWSMRRTASGWIGRVGTTDTAEVTATQPAASTGLAYGFMWLTKAAAAKVLRFEPQGIVIP